MPRFSPPRRFDIYKRHTLLFLVIICTAFNQSDVRAEQIQEYIKNIVGDSMVGTTNCSEEPYSKKSVSTNPSVPYQVSPVKAEDIDYGCLNSVNTVKKRLKEGGALIVDVRHPEEYRHHHIPGSINLPLTAIKYKSSFKDSHIILVNKGLTQRFLLSTCSKLKNSGFNDISVLDGGLRSWIDNGNVLSRGRDGSIEDIYKISPYEYFITAQEYEWVFIAHDTTDKEIRPLIADAKVIENRGDLQDFKGQLDKAKASTLSNEITKFVVVSNDGSNYQSLKRLVSRENVKDIYFLTDGIAGLQSYIHQHSTLLARQKKGFQARMGCNR